MTDPGRDGGTPATVKALRDAWSDRWLAAAVRSSTLDAPFPAFAGLVAAHEELGRTAGPRPVGALALTREVLDRAGRSAAGPRVPVLAGRGRRVLLVERSGPGWRLDGRAEVEWCADVARLAVFALDEGDNEVLVLVPEGVPGVTVTRLERADTTRSFVATRFDGVRLVEHDVVTGLQERAVLEDQLTVLAMADAWGATARLVELAEEAGHTVRALRDDLATARAAVRAASRVAGSVRLVERSLAVSTAAVHVFPVCRRVADVAATLTEDSWTGPLRQRVETHVELADVAWHAERMNPFL